MGYPQAWPGGPPIAFIMAEEAARAAQAAQAADQYRRRKETPPPPHDEVTVDGRMQSPGADAADEAYLTRVRYLMSLR